MPIANRPWTFSSLVISGAPTEPGVYALLEDDEVIYYGCAFQGTTIQSALYAHLNRIRSGEGGCLRPVNRYTWEITYRPRLREAELLREFELAHHRQPRCNQLRRSTELQPVADERRSA